MQLTFELAYGYKLRVLDPDEGKNSKDESCWTFLLEGVRDEEAPTISMNFAAERGVDEYTLSQSLYHNVSSHVVDREIPKIKAILEAWNEVYKKLHPTPNPPAE